MQQSYYWKWFSKRGESTQFVVHLCYYECRYLTEQCDTAHMTNWFQVCMLTCAPPSTGRLCWPTRDVLVWNTGGILHNVSHTVFEKGSVLDSRGQIMHKCTLWWVSKCLIGRERFDLGGWGCFSKAQLHNWHQMNMADPQQISNILSSDHMLLKIVQSTGTQIK